MKGEIGIGEGLREEGEGEREVKRREGCGRDGG